MNILLRCDCCVVFKYHDVFCDENLSFISFVCKVALVQAGFPEMECAKVLLAYPNPL